MGDFRNALNIYIINCNGVEKNYYIMKADSFEALHSYCSTWPRIWTRVWQSTMTLRNTVKPRRNIIGTWQIHIPDLHNAGGKSHDLTQEILLRYAVLTCYMAHGNYSLWYHAFAWHLSTAYKNKFTHDVFLPVDKDCTWAMHMHTNVKFPLPGKCMPFIFPNILMLLHISQDF